MLLSPTVETLRARLETLFLSKKVAIVQSNYIPWRGYFDLLNSVDEFILYDDMQYTKRDWRNRNIIKSPSGPIWLTIPVLVAGYRIQKIKDAVIADAAWAQKHWKCIVHCYSRAKYFRAYAPELEALYASETNTRLSQINFRFITALARLLGITTKITWSMDYEVRGGKTERLVNLCKQVKADEYKSGPAAKTYLDEALFIREGIKISYADYSGYPEYEQLYPPFESSVSIIDLIFNEGPNAQKYMNSF